MTKLERAKRKTLDKVECIVLLVEGAGPDNRNILEALLLLNNSKECGYCKEFWDGECDFCPLFLAENHCECIETEWYGDLEDKINDAHPDTVTDLLAVMVYVHQLEIPDDKS